MQARLIAYPPERAAIARSLHARDTVRIGRGPDCDLVIEHPSISRAHAVLEAAPGGWRLRDLGSKNGSFVNGVAANDALLDTTCWLRFGDIFCEFATLTTAEAFAAEQGVQARRAAATAHTARIGGLSRLDDLLNGCLQAVLDLAQCDRGFVLLADARGQRVHASLALDPARLATREFSGSVGAVQRALESRAPVVSNDIASDAWLASRASVAAAGLSALVCLPLLEGGEAIGAIYADRVRPGPAITTLDLALLEAFTEGAAMWVAARRTSDLLDAQAEDATAWERIVAAQAEAG